MRQKLEADSDGNGVFEDATEAGNSLVRAAPSSLPVDVREVVLEAIAVERESVEKAIDAVYVALKLDLGRRAACEISVEARLRELELRLEVRPHERPYPTSSREDISAQSDCSGPLQHRRLGKLIKATELERRVSALEVRLDGAGAANAEFQVGFSALDGSLDEWKISEAALDSRLSSVEGELAKFVASVEDAILSIGDQSSLKADASKFTDERPGEFSNVVVQPPPIQSPSSGGAGGVKIVDSPTANDSSSCGGWARSLSIKARPGAAVRAANAVDLVAEVWATDLSYALEETIWDSALFVGMGGLTFADTVLVALLQLLNYVAQLVFLLAMMRDPNMTDNRFTGEELANSMLKWRAAYGHSLNHVDAINHQPLAQQVCSNSDTLIEGNLQAELYETMTRYVSEDGMGLPVGVMLCSVALLIWFLTISKEVSSVTYFTRAIWAQPSGTTSIQGTGGSQFSVVSISITRKIAMTMLVSLPRLLIACFLGGYGSLYLISTAGIEDLILNSVALEVVMTIDELIFSAMMPSTVTALMEKTESLPIRRLPITLLKAVSGGRMVVLGGLVTYIFASELMPMVENMRLSQEYLCSKGDKDFVAFRRQSGMMKMGKVGTSHDALDLYSSRAVLHRAKLPFSAGNPRLELPVFYGQWAGSITVEEADRQWHMPITDILVACEDYITYEPELSLAILRNATSNASLASCPDAANYCGRTDHLLTRFYCPDTCGCEDPISGLFAMEGCPASCSQSRVDVLERVPCQDREQSTALATYMENFFYDVVYVTKNVKGGDFQFAPSMEVLQDFVRTQGCAFFAVPLLLNRSDEGGISELFVDFCDPLNAHVAGRRTVRSFCPVTCGCEGASINQQDDDGCPTACRN